MITLREKARCNPQHMITRVRPLRLLNITHHQVMTPDKAQALSTEGYPKIYYNFCLILNKINCT